MLYSVSSFLSLIKQLFEPFEQIAADNIPIITLPKLIMFAAP